MNIAVITFMLSYAAIDFICTMLNRYVFKEEKENQEEPISHEKEK